ncbi:LuxR C-terminal-related transcriptional regulator [Streptomyces sp. NPDC059835]|uniref:helix-turn-helix transcriptional regulator n=1 Tax=Streptomyces sp. NPDC059835 TaxID=3346967 RepID=UPI003649D5EA
MPAPMPPAGVRARELAFLRRQLRIARQGAQFVRVSGEPWSGKTHLLRQLAESAHRDGWTVAFGRAPRGGRSHPYDVLVDALDDELARADGALFERLGPAAARRLAVVFPSLGTTGEREPDDYGTVRALRALLTELSAGGGLLLILDDAHRARPEVVEFVEHVVRHPPDGPVLTVLAHRSGPAGGPLASMAHEAGNLRHVRLAPLSEAEARSLLPAALDPRARALVLRDAAGVPGLVRALAAEPAPGLYGVGELTTGEPPAGAGASVGAVDLHTLSSPGWRTACAAAVLGDPFTVGALARTAGVSLAEVERGLDELHAEAVVVPVPGTLRFRFARPAVRALVHHASGAGWRREARARAVAALREEGPGPWSPALAAHLLDEDGALSEEDARALLLGARAWLFVQPARTLRALDRLAESAGRVPAGLLLLRAKALLLAGRAREAAGVHEEVWPRVHEAWEDGGRADAVLWRARTLRMLGRHAEAAELLFGAGEWAAGPGPLRERLALALALPAGTPTDGTPEHLEGLADLAELAGLAQLAALAGPTAPADPPDRADPRDPTRAARPTAPDGPVGTAGPEGRVGPAGAAGSGGPGGASAGRRPSAELLPAARVHTLALLAAGRVACGDGPGAAAAADAAAELLEGLGPADMAAELEALCLLGGAELGLGRVGRAEARFAWGLRAALEFGQAHLAGSLALGLARAGSAAGDEASAAEYRKFGGAMLAVHSSGAPGNSVRTTEEISVVNRKELPGNGRMFLLSEREREIAGLVGSGYTNQRMAARLDISTKTVETYMSRIFKKLGVRSRAEVAHMVGQSGGR